MKTELSFPIEIITFAVEDVHMVDQLTVKGCLQGRMINSLDPHCCGQNSLCWFTCMQPHHISAFKNDGNNGAHPIGLFWRSSALTYASSKVYVVDINIAFVYVWNRQQTLRNALRFGDSPSVKIR